MFRQPDDFNEQAVSSLLTPVVDFNISAYAQQVGLGDPIAGTFMLVDFDSVICESIRACLPWVSSVDYVALTGIRHSNSILRVSRNDSRIVERLVIVCGLG